MEKKPLIDNNSLSRIIAEKITEQIMTGELRPGEKVVETTYAEEFGTSRAPIREALYLLAIEGLIERIPRKGAVVKGYSIYEIYDLLEIRMMLEELAVKRIAAIGVDAEQLAKMKQLLPQMQNCHDAKHYAELNQKFHASLIEMSHSEIIKKMYSRLSIPLLSLQRISFLEEKNMQKSRSEHQKIVTCLMKDNFIEAKQILKKHNKGVIERVEHHLWAKRETNQEGGG